MTSTRRQVSDRLLATLHYSVLMHQAYLAAVALNDANLASAQEQQPDVYELGLLDQLRVGQIDRLAVALRAHPPITGEDRIDLVHEAVTILEEYPEEYRTWLAEKALD